MTNKTIYIVESSIGQYEDHYTRIEGVFDNHISAEECKSDILAEMKEMSMLPEPEGDTITDEQYKIYYEWYDKHTLANEFNSCYVNEYTLNERRKYE